MLRLSFSMSAINTTETFPKNTKKVLLPKVDKTKIEKFSKGGIVKKK